MFNICFFPLEISNVIAGQLWPTGPTLGNPDPNIQRNHTKGSLPGLDCYLFVVLQKETGF